MEPTIIDVTTKVIAVLLPLVAKGAEEFASKVGDAAYEKAKALLSTLKQRWAGDKEATACLAQFEERPERYKADLEDILQKKLAQDTDLLSRISRLLQEMSPALEIIQQMEEGKDITRPPHRRLYAVGAFKLANPLAILTTIAYTHS